MLPAVLEIFVVWHPDDTSGEQLALDTIEHFHGDAFSGLIGGAVEVFVRSAPFDSTSEKPRPLTSSETDESPKPAALTVVLLAAGNELAAAVETETGEWPGYLEAIAKRRATEPDSFLVFPHMLNSGVFDSTRLGKLFGETQAIGLPTEIDGETLIGSTCRDLAQGIAQHLTTAEQERLTVFVSHTKRYSAAEADYAPRLIQTVRDVIARTRLNEFFDAHDLQPGEDWGVELRERAANSALLAVRTDLYASRDWCQREMAIAKLAGMPVVTLEALLAGEDRGSYLMDHTPKISSLQDPSSDSAGVLCALNRLVDECLKRELWRKHHELVGDRAADLADWWAPHAPEPITLANWLATNKPDNGTPLRIIHPDPPLGREERDQLDVLGKLTGLSHPIEIFTPRGISALGGLDG